MQTPIRTLVMALGNPLRGDDGIGTEILAYVQAHLPYKMDENIVFLDGGTPGFETVLLMEGYTRVLVIDAAQMGLAPGEWRRFSATEVKLRSRDLYLRGTLHYAGLAEALSLGEALGVLPDEIIVFGIEPQAIDWNVGLSAPVTAAVPAVGRAIIQELESCIEYG